MWSDEISIKDKLLNINIKAHTREFCSFWPTTVRPFYRSWTRLHLHCCHYLSLHHVLILYGPPSHRSIGRTVSKTIPEAYGFIWTVLIAYWSLEGRQWIFCLCAGSKKQGKDRLWLSHLFSLQWNLNVLLVCLYSTRSSPSWHLSCWSTFCRSECWLLCKREEFGDRQLSEEIHHRGWSCSDSWAIHVGCQMKNAWAPVTWHIYS